MDKVIGKSYYWDRASHSGNKGIVTIQREGGSSRIKGWQVTYNDESLNDRYYYGGTIFADDEDLYELVEAKKTAEDLIDEYLTLLTDSPLGLPPLSVLQNGENIEQHAKRGLAIKSAKIAVRGLINNPPLAIPRNIHGDMFWAVVMDVLHLHESFHNEPAPSVFEKQIMMMMDWGFEDIVEYRKYQHDEYNKMMCYKYTFEDQKHKCRYQCNKCAEYQAKVDEDRS